MIPEPEKFKQKALQALDQADIQQALADNSAFAAMARQAAVSDPELPAMKARAKKIKDHTLDHLAHYLETYEKNAIQQGIKVHWARTAEEAGDEIKTILARTGARLAVCGKSMIAAEIEAPGVLKESGVERYETDLGEYILQLAGDEPPSHVNAPAAHKTVDQIRALFSEHLGLKGQEGSGKIAPEAILAKARETLRDKFLNADVGIIGANFLIAETGANVLVSNEGNADLSALMPKTLIVLASIEKVLPRPEDAELFLRLLCLSATGQRVTAYQSVYHGPDSEKAQNVHVILLDNGRSRILHSRYRSILRCVRCGACMDNCPVYAMVGGHPYGWIYPGPMGVVWSSLLNGFKGTRDLAHACTLNGHCSEVCPMSIPLKELIRSLREDQWDQDMTPLAERAALGLWGQMVRRPAVYDQLVSLAGRTLNTSKGYIKNLPGAGGWTVTRDLPAFKARPYRREMKKRKTE